MKQPPARWKFILWLAALVVWAFVLVKTVQTFKPSGGTNSLTWSSDSAIVVLMANDDRPITVFNFYYYCADRWGAWQYVLAQGFRRATGFTWTPDSVLVMQATWVLAGAWALAGLCRRDWAIAGIAYLIAACLHRESRLMLFELSQIYGWQITGMVFAWLGVRRIFDRALTPPLAARAMAGWVLFTILFGLLAVWSSVASVPTLAVLCVVEAIRTWARARTSSGANSGADSGANGSVLRALSIGSGFAIAAVGIAAVGERAIKNWYHRWSIAHYGQDFQTRFGIDYGHLMDSLGHMLRHIAGLSWWPLYALPLVAIVVVAVLWIVAMVTRRTSLRDRVAAVLADDTAMAALGAYAIAVVNFTLAVLVDHVRLNDYDDRYLVLTNAFGPIAGILTLFLAIRWLVRAPAVKAGVQPVFVLAGVVLLAVGFPHVGSGSLHYQIRDQLAQMLVQRSPHGVLLGGYWETYVFTALQPPERAMTPVTWEGFSRTPWTPAKVREAREVIVVYEKPGPIRGPSIEMPQTLTQHGATLTLADGHWIENDYYQFGRYINTTPAPR